MLLLKNLKLLILLILLAAVGTGCSEPPQQTLRIGSILWPGYEPLYLAGKLGYYKNHPIKVIDFLSNTNSLVAFKNNNLEAGAFTLDETLQIISEGIDIEIILIMDVSNGGDVILANKNIKNIKDLRGKTIAVESSAVGAYTLKRALELNAMDFNDVKIVSTNTMEQAERFASGEIVAAVTFDPYRTQLLRSGKKEIFNSTMIPNEIVDVLVVRKDYSEKYPETIRHLIKAWFRTLKYQKNNPVKSAEYSLKRYNTTSSDYISSLKLLKFASKEENLVLLDSSKSPLLDQQVKITDVLKQLKLINKAATLNNHLNKRFISG